jgi:uncharacterized membrane protein SpoIIM required for sporulation
MPDLLVVYIDPISGSILLQAIVAAGVGGLAFFRRSIGGFFRRFRRHEPPDNRTEPQAPEE